MVHREDAIRNVKAAVDEYVAAIRMLLEKLNLKNAAEAEDVCKTELALFLLYLAASDGEVKWSEGEVIAKVCDFPVTPYNMNALVQKALDGNYGHKLPETFKFLTYIENTLYEKGVRIDLASSVMSAYRMAGQMLILGDYEADAGEERDLNDFLQRMEDYADENAASRKYGFVAENYTPLKGDSGAQGDREPSPVSVAAPKKG